MADKKDSQATKYLLTINNSEDLRAELIEALEKFKGLVYYVMADEIGGKGNTYHTHIFMILKTATRFSTVKKRFPKAHIDKCRGLNKQNRDYVLKIGVHENTEKALTKVEGTTAEYGELPEDIQGKRFDLENLYGMIKEGMNNYEILEQSPQNIMHIDKIEKIRQTVKQEEFKNTWRDLEVTYIWGETGTGKTRGIMEEYGYQNVYRATNYQNPWDGYEGQDVVIFEEFRSSLKIQDMLNLLDGYPLKLACRYADKVACFTKVYIITNIDLYEQYETVQSEHPETWNAFKRRIHKTKYFTSKGIIEETLTPRPQKQWTEEDLLFTIGEIENEQKNEYSANMKGIQQ